jgi:NADPH:quinone reductase-like Zn-dependent oxidoreductase
LIIITRRTLGKIQDVRIHHFGGSGVLQAEYIDIEHPLLDGSQVLINVKAASGNPANFKIRNGRYAAV